jgi:acyl carrier protein
MRTAWIRSACWSCGRPEEAFGIVFEDSDFDVRNFISVAALRDFVLARLPA